MLSLWVSTAVWLAIFAVFLAAGIVAALSTTGRGVPGASSSVRRGLRDAARRGLPACGACGHANAAWDGSAPTPATCSRCGAAYAKAGLLTRATCARAGAPLWMAAMLLAVPAALLAWEAHNRAVRHASVPAATVSPVTAPVHRQVSFDLVPTRGADPYNPAYTLTYGIDAHGDELETGVRPNERKTFEAASGEIRLWASGDGVPRTLLRFDPAADLWWLEDATSSPPAILRGGPGLANGVAALFAHTRLDERPFADAEMHEARAWVGYMHGDPRPNGFEAVGPASESRNNYDAALWMSGGPAGAISYAYDGPVQSAQRPFAMRLLSAAAALPPLVWAAAVALLWWARRRALAA